MILHRHKRFSDTRAETYDEVYSSLVEIQLNIIDLLENPFTLPYGFWDKPEAHKHYYDSLNQEEQEAFENAKKKGLRIKKHWEEKAINFLMEERYVQIRRSLEARKRERKMYVLRYGGKVGNTVDESLESLTDWVGTCYELKKGNILLKKQLEPENVSEKEKELIEDQKSQREKVEKLFEKLECRMRNA
ncbi:hypothetical protein SAMN05421737_104134 [Shouchella lonarensis]|uniref:Uncharacterized protein n=1 Tax=Shouchella lonarensis TaxID=1464122 RepID=A0A1G6HR45_9BACI|nr:hypothetical protein SAMN05421737_104134 [Shouchella lonarensis]